MDIEKPKKLSPEERERRTHERIWGGDAHGAKYFPPGEAVPRSAWEPVRVHDRTSKK